MLLQKGATYFLVFVVAGVLAENSAERGTKKYDGKETEERHDMGDDNVADSSVTSYSNVVIHHSNGKNQNGEEDVQPSRSESYFKVFNSGKKFRDDEQPKQERPVRHEELKIKPVEHLRQDEVKIRQQENFQAEKNFKQNEGYKHEPKYRHRDERRQEYNNDERKREPKFELNEDSRRVVSSLIKHDGPEHRGNSDYRDYPKNHKAKAHPPPGMTEELMESLLQQEPQRFGDTEKVKRYEPKKKFKTPRGETPNTFNVGYSIGFGQPQEDVVVGRPKDVKLHVNGQKSVWKQLNENVEMSQDLGRKKPHLYRVSDSAQRGATPQINVLKNGGSSVFYMNNNSPDIKNIPTEGKVTFDHNHALTQSNTFDFSNAMSNPPLALPLQANFAPETQPFKLKPKARGFDLMSLYQSMGYSAPIPVFIPDTKGEGTMIQAIVIPLQSLPNMDFNWGNFAGMYNNPVPQNAMNFNSFHSPNVPNFNVNHGNHPNNANHVNHGNHVPQLFHGQNFNKDKPRTPKSNRKPKDLIKSGTSFSTSPIVVSPLTHSSRPIDLQKEQAALNAILAQELLRKNRHSPLGMRPPPFPHS